MATKVCLNPLAYLKMRESKPTTEQKQTLEHVAHEQTITKPEDFRHSVSYKFLIDPVINLVRATAPNSLNTQK